MNKILLVMMAVSSTVWSAPDELARENAHTAGKTVVIPGKGLCEVALDRANATYKCGESAEFTVTIYEKDKTLAKTGKYYYQIDNYGAHVFEKKDVDLEIVGNPFKVKGTLEYPGFLRLEVKSGKNTLRHYSAAYEPERITTAEPKPDDFDKFWDGAVKRLQKKVPLDAKVKKVETSRQDVEISRVSFATFGGKRVYGVLALPKQVKGKLPVDLNCPGAGPGYNVKSLANQARKDRITLWMSIHDFEVGMGDAETKARYEEQEKRYRALDAISKARAYPVAGLSLSREQGHYFNRIVGINRAFDWAAALPNADRANIYYHGASQGGGMGLILTGLNKSIRRAYMGVPAMCDLLSCKHDGRQSGWPRITEYEPKEPADHLARVQENCRYFDAAYFCDRIRVPVRLSVGYADESCAPHSVLAAYNRIPAKDKKLYHGIGGVHSSRNAPMDEVNAFLGL